MGIFVTLIITTGYFAMSTVGINRARWTNPWPLLAKSVKSSHLGSLAMKSCSVEKVVRSNPVSTWISILPIRWNWGKGLLKYVLWWRVILVVLSCTGMQTVPKLTWNQKLIPLLHLCVDSHDYLWLENHSLTNDDGCCFALSISGGFFDGNDFNSAPSNWG